VAMGLPVASVFVPGAAALIPLSQAFSLVSTAIGFRHNFARKPG
jgi:hypothetical protein